MEYENELGRIVQYKSQVTIEDKVTKVQEWLFERVREVLMKEIDNLGKINQNLILCFDMTLMEYKVVMQHLKKNEKDED